MAGAPVRPIRLALASQQVVLEVRVELAQVVPQASPVRELLSAERPTEIGGQRSDSPQMVDQGLALTCRVE
jgi:hypothetical protein